MKNFTQRQVWKVLRNLVSDNNSEIKQVFSASVAGTYRGFSKKIQDKNQIAQLESQKNYVISSGVRELYKEIADRFFERDPIAKQKYFKINNEDKNWQDNLSPRDLFYLYNFQNRVLRSFDKVESLNTNSARRAIRKTNFGKYFSGEVEFTGKPAKTPDDKRGFDVEDKDNIEGVLLQVSLNEHQRYCKRVGLDPAQTERQMIEKSRFGEYTGGVASRYFKQKQQADEYLQEQEDEEDYTEHPVTHPEFGKHVGFTDDGTPLYEDEQGRYIASTGESYSGQIFGFKNDKLVYRGETELPDEQVPTAQVFKAGESFEQS